MNLSLVGKTALVGGGSLGIGLASAIELSKLGATCILVSRNEENLTAAVRKLDTSSGQQHRYLVADYAHPEVLRQTLSRNLANQNIDILVNNTGGPAGGPISGAQPEAFLAAFQQHLICNHIVTTHVVPAMKVSGFGRIINIISTSVRIPLKDLGVSNTIRGAVASWAKTMANELGQYGITVNNVLPGATATERLSSIINNKALKTGWSVAEAEAEMVKEIPAGRFAQPEEIGSVVAFLAAPAAGYINGVSIPVDGGRLGCI
jgi:3-oxoacyl-[acyl-carrier protein] reductase